MRKINQGQKYSGSRNAQKRKGNTKNNFSATAENALLIGLGVVAVAAVVVVVVAALPVDAVVGAIAGIGAALSWAFSW